MDNFPEFPIILVDDEEPILEGYELSLQHRGINNYRLFRDSREVIPYLEKNAASVVVTDLYMPHLTGQDLLNQISELYPHIPVIVVTGTKDVGIAIECMKRGVYDYIIKPVDINRLISTVKKAIELSNLKEEVSRLQKQIFEREIENPDAFSAIKTGSESMLAIFRYVEAVAPSPKPVIITGESGVGKELVAQAVHNASRRKGPFIAINIAGLDDNLFSDTLFGHRKGAFTGAEKDRDGLIKKAEGGTIFLDEIGDMEPKSQIKLLRLLQENQYYPLGSDTPERCEVRTIVATNVDLKEKQESGEFRRDLYYRLMTHYIRIPPLRERYEDLPVLVEHFMEKACSALNKTTLNIPDELFPLLETYHFPGNIREIEAMLYNAVSISREETALLAAVEKYILQHSSFEGKGMGREKTEILNILTNNNKLPSLLDVERFLLKKAMDRARGNQSVAAPMIGLTPSAFCRRLKKFELKNGE